MIYLVAFVVLVLATARLTRLVSRDDLTTRVRLWIDTRFGENSWKSKLIWCFWCSGVWVSMFTSTVMVGSAQFWMPLTWGQSISAWIFLVPAAAYGASWIVDKESD